MILGEWVRAWRLKRDISLRDMAAELGITTGTLHRFEAGGDISGASLKKIWLVALAEEQRQDAALARADSQSESGMFDRVPEREQVDDS